jgi:hypothetical protein
VGKAELVAEVSEALDDAEIEGGNEVGTDSGSVPVTCESGPE